MPADRLDIETVISVIKLTECSSTWAEN